MAEVAALTRFDILVAEGAVFLEKAIDVEVLVTDTNFDEKLYLATNPDVAASVRAGHFSSGLQHFLAHGRTEGRKIRYSSDKLASARQNKLNRIEASLREDMRVVRRNGKLDFLTPELRKKMRIVGSNNVSAHDYSGIALDIISRNKLVLDCGCGRRPKYFHNVVNYEIVDYDTTDVIGVGECLPFKDNTFDAVVSIAVLEHVRDPFVCAQEISRVLKPGGELYCSVPFLQPYHGYPHHYFNATHQGIRRLFEDQLDISHVSSEGDGHPIFALHWILRSWLEGLPPDAKELFRSKSIGDILDSEPNNFLNDPITKLRSSAMKEIACSFEMIAKKPTNFRRVVSSVFRTSRLNK